MILSHRGGYVLIQMDNNFIDSLERSRIQADAYIAGVVHGSIVFGLLGLIAGFIIWH